MSSSDKNSGKHLPLSKRQKTIIQMLTRMAGKPVTIATISEKLGVSSRTVLREMPVIERWLDDNDFRFVRKPGVGLTVSEDAESLALLEELLEVQDIVPMYSRQERRRQILGELFFYDEPVKAYVFTSKYHISEGTLYEDLDSLGSWLKDYDIKIIRKQGTGIFLSGSELSYRQAIANAVFEFIDVEKIFGLLSDYFTVEKQADLLSKNLLLSFLDFQTLNFVKKVMKKSEKQQGVKYTDNGYIGLVVRISLMIYRVRNGKNILFPAKEAEQLQAIPEYSAANKIADEIEEQLLLKISVLERCYIAMKLASARIWTGALDMIDPIDIVNIRVIVMSMVALVEQQTGLPFRSCSGMIDDLVSHINSIVNRKTINMEEVNEHTETVKENYPEIYRAVESACELLKEFIYTKKLPEAEIGYISMHFAAAAEQLQEYDEKIIVVVVCPAGIGSSKMLIANLKRSFHNIEVRKGISAFDIDVEKLKQEGVDLILTTTPIHIDFPCLCVSTVLKTQDKLLIQSEIEAINRNRIHLKTRRKFGEEQNGTISLEAIYRMSLIGIEIVEILSNMEICRKDCVNGIHELIESVSMVFPEYSKKEMNQIVINLKKREELGGTYIPGMDICLLHCRTEVVRHSRFRYLQLVHPFAGEQGMIRGAVVMLAPVTEPDRICSEPISRLSALLVEEQGFLQALQRGDKTAAVAFAKEALVKYYQKETLKQKGGDRYEK